MSTRWVECPACTGIWDTQYGEDEWQRKRAWLSELKSRGFEVHSDEQYEDVMEEIEDCPEMPHDFLRDGNRCVDCIISGRPAIPEPPVPPPRKRALILDKYTDETFT